MRQGFSYLFGDTLLRLIRRAAAPNTPTPEVLAVDDFAFRRGARYGTILVDLERHQTVDLLPDRTAETLAHWLRQHPGVKVISRDRGGSYAEDGRPGAPDAPQIADRFHVSKNLAESLDQGLMREQRVLQAVAKRLHEPEPSQAPAPPPEQVVRRRPPRQLRDGAIRRERPAGSSLGLARRTSPPRQTDRRRHGRSSPGTHAHLDRAADALAVAGRHQSPSPQDVAYRAALLEQSSLIQQAQTLVSTFFRLVRQREGAALDPWLMAAEQRDIPELVGFVQGIRRDAAAVEAALRFEWSQGQTEGRVNQLKFVKRSMYGRGKLDLLRRLLSQPAS